MRESKSRTKKKSQKNLKLYAGFKKARDKKILDKKIKKYVLALARNKKIQNSIKVKNEESKQENTK